MKHLKILGTIIGLSFFLASCGGGGDSNELSLTPPAPVVDTTSARALSCNSCTQGQLDALQSAGAAVASSTPGDLVVVTLTMTLGDYYRLVDDLRTNAASTLPGQTPAPEQTAPATSTNCYLEYEYGRYEYECDDDDYVANLPPSSSTLGISPHCYYEYEHGRREYECESDRYVIEPLPAAGSTIITTTLNGRAITLTLPYPNPVRCEREYDEYECYFANGYECEYEHGRWECEYEGRYSSLSAPKYYYALPEKEVAAADGKGLPFLRGYLRDSYALAMDNFLFSADSDLRTFHLEYRMSPIQFGDVSFFADGGFRRENAGQTTAHYGEISGMYSLLPDVDIYAQALAGGVNSEYYENSRLFGLDAGFSARNILRRDDAWRVRLYRPSAAAELSKWKFSVDANIREENRDIRLFLWSDLTDNAKGASAFYEFNL